MRIIADDTSKIKIIMEAGEELLVVNEDLMPIEAYGQSIDDLEFKRIKSGEIRIKEA